AVMSFLCMTYFGRVINPSTYASTCRLVCDDGAILCATNSSELTPQSGDHALTASRLLNSPSNSPRMFSTQSFEKIIFCTAGDAHLSGTAPSPLALASANCLSLSSLAFPSPRCSVLPEKNASSTSREHHSLRDRSNTLRH